MNPSQPPQTRKYVREDRAAYNEPSIRDKYYSNKGVRQKPDVSTQSKRGGYDKRDNDSQDDWDPNRRERISAIDDWTDLESGGEYRDSFGRAKKTPGESASRKKIPIPLPGDFHSREQGRNEESYRRKKEERQGHIEPEPYLREQNRLDDERNYTIGSNLRELSNEQLVSAGDKDLTIHFELDIGVNLQQEIESFSKLCRFGDFRAARLYFDNNLREYIGSPYLFLCYAQMLLEMGDYKNLSALESPFEEGHGIDLHATEFGLDHLRQAVEASCHARTGLKNLESFDVVYPLYNEDLGSYKVKQQRHALLYHAHLRRYSRFEDSLEGPIESPFEAGNILRAQGRIWDWRDIFVADVVQLAAAATDGYADIINGRRPAEFCDQILGPWMSSPSDLVTNMALLDMLTSLALVKPLSAKSLVGAKEFTGRAEAIVLSIAEYHPSALRSRQYVRWMLAKVVVSTYREDTFLAEFPGLAILKEDALDLQIYIPPGSETSVVTPPPQGSQHNDKIELILSLAKQLEDYQSQVMCLKQLILRSADPMPIFDELTRLQQETQHDIHGALRTLLAKFAYCSDAASRDLLREEILGLGDCSRLTPNMKWARYAVLKALVPTVDEANEMQQGAVALKHAVTRDLRAFMRKFGWIPRGPRRSHKDKDKKEKTNNDNAGIAKKLTSSEDDEEDDGARQRATTQPESKHNGKSSGAGNAPLPKGEATTQARDQASISPAAKKNTDISSEWTTDDDDSSQRSASDIAEDIAEGTASGSRRTAGPMAKPTEKSRPKSESSYMATQRRIEREIREETTRRRLISNSKATQTE